WHVQVSRGKNLVVVERVAQLGTQSSHNKQPGGEVDRDQIKRVHERNPQEDGKRQWRNKPARVFVRDDAFGLVFDHAHQHFDAHLKAPRHTSSDAAGSTPKEVGHDGTHQDGPEHGVIVDDAEVGDRFLLGPDVVQLHQVMLYVSRLWRNIT